ncbi:MAG: pyridine nucleotide-disulfide oxidoreductase [Nitrospirae bacterium]|nr:MAG: pyridine nucleotide-disulfide oxidoreductase [Nitrospirota bacterium]
MLAGDYALEEIGFDIKGMIESAGGIFVQDKVVEVKAKSRELILQSGAKVGYDVVSFNIGSIVSSEINLSGKEDVFTVKPIYNLYRARQRIMNWPEGSPLRIAVIGGGPAAVEVVGCAWTLTNSRGLNASLEIVAGERLLKRFPERVRSIVFKSFRERGIKVIEGVRAKKVEDDKIVLENGDTIKADIIFLSTGVKPPELFIKSGLPVGPDGGLLVNEYLQSVAHPELFGGGDCIYFKPRPLEKVGVYDVRENPVLFHNLLAALEGRPLMKFNPGSSYLLVFNLGGRKGVFWKNSLIFNGKIAFFIKDYIDRRFIRRFKI